jgi:hypothetical protein
VKARSRQRCSISCASTDRRRPAVSRPSARKRRTRRCTRWARAVRNTTNQEQSYSITVQDQQTYADSITVSAKAAFKVAEIVNVELTATYGHTWTQSHTFTQQLNIKVPAQYESFIYAEQPIFRVYGDFTLQLGNTKWILRNVYFDTPNPNGQGAYEIRERPLTPEQVESLPPIFDRGTNLPAVPLGPDDPVLPSVPWLSDSRHASAVAV